ncbi:class I SAM-dependent methyltransferase [Qipengyuania sp. ASV99]|uniref:class I SAM-dependent methyltransferase n=1 Tax=Qipengyuania sp. ASV99 TaxID=3399681 RepID=UPI003A4C5C81
MSDQAADTHIDPATYDFYQSEAPFYSFCSAIGTSRHLDGFLDRLKPGARVLELGCGAGRDSARILERGFDLDATDGIPAMVAKANERHAINARLMRFDQLAAVQEYDAVWAHACLLHCPRAQLPDVLASVHRALRPQGWHYASYKLGTGEGRDLLGRLHNFPAAQWLRDTYRAAMFEIVEEQVFAGMGSDGTQRDWMALTVRRAR